MFVVCICFLWPMRPKHLYCRVIKLCFLSSRFENQDLFVGSRITYPSESHLLWKVMSEVSVSRRHRSPSARSASPLTCTPSFSGPRYRSNRKAQKTFWQKDFFRGKFLMQRGFPPSSPRARVGLCRGKADSSLTVRLYLCM